jgi:hypothetical protein
VGLNQLSEGQRSNVAHRLNGKGIMSAIKAILCFLCDLNYLEDQMLVVEGLDALLARGPSKGEYILKRPVDRLDERVFDIK